MQQHPTLQGFCEYLAKDRLAFQRWTFDKPTVEKNQRKEYGPLFKDVLPVDRFDIRAYQLDLRFVERVVANDVEHQLRSFMVSAHPSAALIGLSGCGKSYELVQFARKNWCIFIDCTESALSPPRDLNMHALTIAVGAQVHAQSDPHTFAVGLCKIDVLARLIAFHAARSSLHGLRPDEWLDIQLSWAGQHTIERLCTWLRILSPGQLANMALDVSAAIHDEELPFVIDEAGVLRATLKNIIVSRTMQPDGTGAKGDWERGLLGAYADAIYGIGGHTKIILAGTDVKLGDIKVLTSSAAKAENRPIRLTGFRAWTPHEQLQYLTMRANLDRGSLETWTSKVGRGRPRWCERLVKELTRRVTAKPDRPLSVVVERAVTRVVSEIVGPRTLLRRVAGVYKTHPQLLVRLYYLGSVWSNAWVDVDRDAASALSEVLCYLDAEESSDEDSSDEDPPDEDSSEAPPIYRVQISEVLSCPFWTAPGCLLRLLTSILMHGCSLLFSSHAAAFSTSCKATHISTRCNAVSGRRSRCLAQRPARRACASNSCSLQV